MKIDINDFDCDNCLFDVRFIGEITREEILLILWNARSIPESEKEKIFRHPRKMSEHFDRLAAMLRIWEKMRNEDADEEE